MTDIALRPAAAPAQDPTGGRLVAWADSLSAAHKIGQALCSTAFVPQHFRNKPEEAAAAILYGDEIGLTPTQSLQSVYVIGGKPALYARTMLAIVLAAGHEVETIKKSDTEVSVRGRRRGSPTWITETWTKARAQKAGYTNNKKYESDPQAMLYSRAVSDICRQIAPDALAGLGYSVEEMEVAEAPAAPATVTLSRQRKPQQAPTPAVEAAPEPEPVVDTDTGEIVDAEVVEEPSDKPSAAQMRMMGALMRQVGLSERDAVLQYVGGVIGREVESRNDLTGDEAGRVIDALTELTAMADDEESDQ